MDKTTANSTKTEMAHRFKKGQSGNPKGRPKLPESVKNAFSGMMPLALDAIRNILNGTDEEARANDRIKAAEIVFDRNLGKPLQKIDANINETKTIDTSKLNEDEKEVLAKLAIESMEDDEE